MKEKKDWDKILNKFYKYLGEENHRYNSFNLCFNFFQKLKQENKKYSNLSSQEKDLAMLNLAFYLASWGMYRGSSFLLQKDYKIYELILKKIWEEKFEILWGFDFKNIEEKNKEKISELIIELDMEIKKILDDIRKTVNSKVKNRVSSILSTKILLGTVGCVPAYDRFFKNGLRKENDNFIQLFSKNSVMKILDFISINKKEISRVQKELSKKYKNNEVPDMKIVDAYFFIKGDE